MASKNVGKLVGGGVVLIVGIIVVFALRSAGNRDTTVVVNDPQGTCVVVTKSDIPDGKKDKFVNWIIDNQCNPAGLVTIGNFRTTQSPSANDCRNATEGAATWPFKEDPMDITKRQHRNKISLKIKTDSELPGNGLVYYFDICTGDNAERRSDPRLVIDP